MLWSTINVPGTVIVSHNTKVIHWDVVTVTAFPV